MNSNKCSFVIKNRGQCKANAMRNNKFCFMHGVSKEKQKEVSRKGGQVRLIQKKYGQPVTLDTPKDLKNFISGLINGVLIGQIPVPVASGLGFLAQSWLKAHEISDISQKLDEIETKLEKEL